MKPKRSIDAGLKGRIATQELTPELLRDGSEHGEVTEERVERAALRFERTYNAVAMVRESDEPYSSDTGYTITAIAAQDANMEEIRRGMQSILHWVLEDEEIGPFEPRDS